MAQAMAQGCCHLLAAPAAYLQSPVEGFRTRRSAAGLRLLPTMRSASRLSSSVSVQRRRSSRASASAEPEEKPAAPSEPVAEKFSAAKYSMGEEGAAAAAKKSGELSDVMKEKMRKEYLGLGGSPNSPLKGNPFLTIIIGITVLVLLFQLFGQG